MRKKEIKQFNELVNRKVAEKLVEIADSLPTNFLGVEGIAKNVINREVRSMLKEEVDYLNTQPQTEDKIGYKFKTEDGGEGILYDGSNTQDTPKESGYDTREILLSGTKPLEIPQDTPEECKEKAKAFDDMHDILKPYHREAEYYPATLKRVLDEKEREVLERVKGLAVDLSMLHLVPHIRVSDIEEELDKLKSKK